MRRVCVFCGSQTGIGTRYATAAQSLGQLLCQKGWGLVFGGGHIGLMGVIADEVLAGGGEVIGVIPRDLVERELAHQGLSRLRITNSMHERKQLMFDQADAFIAMPGGMGTLEELGEMLTWAQLGYHEKPCGLLNVNGYFTPLLEFFDQAVREGFLRPQHRKLLRVHENPEILLEMMFP